MANQGKNMNNSQFFITLDEWKFLNSRYVVFGQIIKGYSLIK